MAHEAGKGSAQRPTNHQAFSEAFDRIFGVTSKQLDHVDASDISEECVDEDEENEHEEEKICNRCRTEMSVTGTYLHWHCDVCGKTEKIERDEP